MTDSPPNQEQHDPSREEVVALSYTKHDLPRVVAKGKGHIARKIMAIAKDAEVPIHQDANLVKALSNLDINESIPRELFLAVAQVLVFAYNISGKTPKEDNDLPPTL